MTRSRPLTFLAGAALAALAAAAAGCGGGGATAATSPPKTPSGQTATVGAAKNALGTILVDSQGRTLYLFKADSGTTSACTGACASAWPPLQVQGTPTAGSGLQASLLGTSKRSDGTTQVTYNGHPLYTFAQDHSAGETAGQGVEAFGAAWFTLAPSGNQITTKPPSSSGGGGLGY
jgi:predicted lipoprotein with Yx(FWY)xxD motif